jgi:hypothetical protein
MNASLSIRDVLIRQLDLAWQLAWFHLESVTTTECLWRPAATGLHVHAGPDGRWNADWPDHERYDLGPASIGWLTWHLGFWWSMALDHNFGTRSLSRERVAWPGDADGVRRWILGLHDQWSAHLTDMTDTALSASPDVRWPFEQRAMADLMAWANIELAKSAAEIGYARFLFAGSQRQP